MKTLFVIILLATPLYAQSSAEVTGTTPSGDPTATYHGKKYLMLELPQVTAINDKLDRLAQLESALPICQKLNADSEARIATALKQGDGWRALFDTEHQLRLDQQAFIKRPSRVSSFLERWYIKLPMSFAPTIVSSFK